MLSGLEFRCKLAHSDVVKKIANFNSIKELYDKISNNFSLPKKDILYCTLNTHNFRDTDSLLSNYLTSNDLIVVHVIGTHREVLIKKTQEYIGLTITDNSHGRAFVKKVKSIDSQVDGVIQPGDHIFAINSDSMIGLRHYEVARAIRDIPQDTTFTMKLVEPKHSLDFLTKQLDLKNKKASEGGKNLETNNQNSISTTTTSFDFSSLDTSYCDDLLNSSLPMEQLLSKSHIDNEQSVTSSQVEVNSQQVDIYRTTIDKINSVLESFLGIHDNLLAIQIYRLAHENKHSYNQFSNAIKISELNVFNFDQDTLNHLWYCANGLVV